MGPGLLGCPFWLLNHWGSWPGAAPHGTGHFMLLGVGDRWTQRRSFRRPLSLPPNQKNDSKRTILSCPGRASIPGIQGGSKMAAEAIGEHGGFQNGGGEEGRNTCSRRRELKILVRWIKNVQRRRNDKEAYELQEKIRDVAKGPKGE